MRCNDGAMDLFRLSYRYPDLPVIPVVYIGSGQGCLVIRRGELGEVCRYHGMMFTDRDDFEMMYYAKNREDIDKRYGVSDGRTCGYGIAPEIREYLKTISENAFHKAIIAYIGTDTENTTKDLEYKGD